MRSYINSASPPILHLSPMPMQSQRAIATFTSPRKSKDSKFKIQVQVVQKSHSYDCKDMKSWKLKENYGNVPKLLNENHNRFYSLTNTWFIPRQRCKYF